MHLNFPAYPLRLRKQANRNEIFDEVRKRWLVCTPEEWVRQHLVKWLITELGYPASNIALEGGLKINQLQKRTDVLCYKNGKPFLLVECKAPEVPINQLVFNQLFRYNKHLNAPFFGVSNGVTHFWAQLNDAKNGINMLQSPPHYSA